MTESEKVGLLDGVPLEILDAYERRAKDVAALWGNASSAARQAVLVSMLRAWHSGRAQVADLERSVMRCVTLADLRSVQITIQRIHEAEASKE